MPSSNALRTFAIKTDDAGGIINVQIGEKAGVTADNLSLATWGSSFILANILWKYKDQMSKLARHPRSSNQDRIPVLELGAGTGLVGLSAASIWRLPVLFTDLSPILPGLSENLSLNKGMLADAGVEVSYGTLDWTKPSELTVANSENDGTVLRAADTKAQIIMAADTCYSEEHPQLMTQTIAAWLAPGPDARVFITYAQRVAYLDQIRELWERLESAGLVSIDEGRVTGDDTWDENAPFEWSVWKWKE